MPDELATDQQAKRWTYKHRLPVVGANVMLWKTFVLVGGMTRQMRCIVFLRRHFAVVNISARTYFSFLADRRSHARRLTPLHCKNIRISTDILWRVFLTLTEPVPHTFVWVNRRNNETPTSLFRRFMDTNVYGKPVPLKYGKLVGIYRYFYSA